MKTSTLLIGVMVALACTIPTTTTVHARPMEGCSGHPADVIFVLDVSSSIWEEHFKDYVLTFVQHVVGELDVGPGPSNTRVGAITFSGEVKREFSLNDYMDMDVLLDKVAAIEPRGGNTDTHEALEFVDRQMFLSDQGARANVSHVVIVITDGASRKVKETEKAARSLKENGSVVFALGVGSSVNTTQLHAIASQPGSQFVFHVTDFQALNNVRKEVVEKTCQVLPSTTTTTTSTTTTTPTTTTTTPATTTTTTIPPTTTTTEVTTTTTTIPPTTTTTEVTTTTTPTTTTTTPTTTTTTTTTTEATTTTTSTTESTTDNDFLGYNVNDYPLGDSETVDCTKRPADIYFVLDSSSSIWVFDFEVNMLGFVHDVIDLYDVASDRTRFGIITFSEKPRTVFGLGSHVYKDELLKAVNKDNVKYTPGLTHTSEALQQARINLHSEGRQGVNQIVILITDGRSWDHNATLATARAARNEGVTIFAVGVGKGVDMTELHALATQPSHDFVLKVEDFGALSSSKFLLAGRTCRVNSTLLPAASLPPSHSARYELCQLQHADILFAYDWTMVGGTVSSHITATLHSLSTTLDAIGADVTLGTITSSASSSSSSSSSSPCLQQRMSSAPLSRSLELGKHTRSLLRSQQSRLAGVLKSVRMAGFSSKNGHRLSAKKVLVVVLDASSVKTLTQVALEAAKVRDLDVEVFVLTSGLHAGRQFVHDRMASQPSTRHVIHLPALDFSDADFASRVILDALCGVNDKRQH